MSRRAKIEALLNDDPRDTFLRYSLAMELGKEGDHERSLAKFAELTRDDPPYVPAFFMAGQQLARLNRLPEARERLRAGVEQARAGRRPRGGRDERVPGVSRAPLSEPADRAAEPRLTAQSCLSLIFLNHTSCPWSCSPM